MCVCVWHLSPRLIFHNQTAVKEHGHRVCVCMCVCVCVGSEGKLTAVSQKMSVLSGKLSIQFLW